MSLTLEEEHALLRWIRDRAWSLRWGAGLGRPLIELTIQAQECELEQFYQALKLVGATPTREKE